MTGSRAFDVSMIAAITGLLMIGEVCLSINGRADDTTNQQTRPSNVIPNEPSMPSGNTAKQDLPAYNVLYVVDGDTIKIDYNGTPTSVRLIGVNTPETVDPRKSVECFGMEASNYLKGLLEGKTVTIESDHTQSDRDVYDRLLRYVYLDGEDINHKIILNGYGYEYTYNFPYLKQQDYKDAQKDAEENSRGLWADGVCSL